jgi:hypothetical protein
LSEGWEFCPHCGTQILPASTISGIDAYIQNKLTLELSNRLKDQSSIVRELADKAEDTLGNRIKRYTIILGIALAILGYFGLKPLYDIYAQIKPMVSSADHQIQGLTQAISKIASEVTVIKATADHLSSDADDQARRVAQKGSEISEKLQSLDRSATALSTRLDAMEKSLEPRVEQLSKQVDNVTIRQAYPTLGQPKFVTYNGGGWKGKAAKEADEKWINVYIDVTSTGDFNPEQIEKLMEAFKKAGYTPLLGMFGIAGPYAGGFGNFGNPANGATTVFYFNRNSEQMAHDVAVIASKTLSVGPVKPQLVDPSTLSEDLAFVIENSGLDLQLYLFRPRK